MKRRITDHTYKTTKIDVPLSVMGYGSVPDPHHMHRYRERERLIKEGSSKLQTHYSSLSSTNSEDSIMTQQHSSNHCLRIWGLDFSTFSRYSLLRENIFWVFLFFPLHYWVFLIFCFVVSSGETHLGISLFLLQRSPFPFVEGRICVLFTCFWLVFVIRFSLYTHRYLTVLLVFLADIAISVTYIIIRVNRFESWAVLQPKLCA